MRCQCIVGYKGYYRGGKKRQCRRIAAIGGTKCWQHSRLNPCCSKHGVQR